MQYIFIYFYMDFSLTYTLENNMLVKKWFLEQ